MKFSLLEYWGYIYFKSYMAEKQFTGDFTIVFEKAKMQMEMEEHTYHDSFVLAIHPQTTMSEVKYAVEAGLDLLESDFIAKHTCVRLI